MTTEKFLELARKTEECFLLKGKYGIDPFDCELDATDEITDLADRIKLLTIRSFLGSLEKVIAEDQEEAADVEIVAKATLKALKKTHASAARDNAIAICGTLGMAGKEAAVEKILAAYYKEIIKKAKEFVRELSQKEGPGAI